MHSLSSGGFLADVPIPIGSAYCSVQRKRADMFIYFTSFLEPCTIFRYDTAAAYAPPPRSPGGGGGGGPGLEAVLRSRVQGLDAEAYETTQEFVASPDGTRVPLFLVTRRGFVRDGSAPTLLYGYGGFSISMTPAFSVARMAFARHFGAAFAVAVLRGGNEYGEAWHKAGALGSKQNVFDDFAACARHLAASGVTTAARLAIEGHSNGGLLVAATANQVAEIPVAGAHSSQV